MSMTTPPWAPEAADVRDWLRVHRRWPVTTLYVAVVIVAFVALCWAGAAR